MEKIDKKILIVEDNESFCLVLKSKLLDAGFIVLTAKDGEEALKIIKNENFDLILLDILMPKINGIDVANKIREEKNDVIIIFLTDLSDTKNISGAIQSSPSDYIVKSEQSMEEVVEKVKLRLNIQ
jgi:DNA-binding response OmpR family regulator